MHTYVTVGSHIVNLANVVSFDLEGGFIRRIFYAGSPTPLEIPAPGIAAGGPQGLLAFLQARGFLA